MRVFLLNCACLPVGSNGVSQISRGKFWAPRPRQGGVDSISRERDWKTGRVESPDQWHSSEIMSFLQRLGSTPSVIPIRQRRKDATFPCKGKKPKKDVGTGWLSAGRKNRPRQF